MNKMRYWGVSLARPKPHLSTSGGSYWSVSVVKIIDKLFNQPHNVHKNVHFVEVIHA